MCCKKLQFVKYLLKKQCSAEDTLSEEKILNLKYTLENYKKNPYAFS